MSSTEELQARLEYVEAILASQTALLAPHLNNLVASVQLQDHSTSHSAITTEQQNQLNALHSFHQHESSKLVAPLQLHSATSYTPDEQQHMQAHARSIDAGPYEINTLEHSNDFRLSEAIQNSSSADPSSPEGRRSKRVRYTFERGFVENSSELDLLGSSGHHNDHSGTWTNSSTTELVPPGLMTILVEEYFARVHPLLPVLHPPTFLKELSSYRANQKNTVDSTEQGQLLTGASSKIIPILHAIVAATVRFIPDGPPITDRFRDLAEFVRGEKRKSELRSSAFELVVIEAVDNPTFEILQALAIVVLASIGQGSPPFAWGLTGMMCRMTVQLGLNREVDSILNDVSPIREIGQPFQPFVLPANFLPPPRDSIEAEHRRRVFWVIFMIDRICATGTGWSVALNRRDFDVDLPCSDHLWEDGIVSKGRQPSASSAFRWGPDASVSEESNSPRLRLWLRERPQTTGLNREVLRTSSVMPSLSPAAETSLSESATSMPSVSSEPSQDIPRNQIRPTVDEAAENQSSDMNEPLGPIANLVEAFEALSQVIAFIQQPTDVHSTSLRLSHLAELESSLTSWKETWSEEVKTMTYIDKLGVSQVSPVKALIHAVYISSIIMLHQTFAYPTKENLVQIPEEPHSPKSSTSHSTTTGFSESFQNAIATSVGACIDATKSMDALIEMLGADILRMNHLMAFFIFISARARLVHILTEGHISLMRTEIKGHLRALKSISAVWGLGHYFLQALELGCTFIEEASTSSSPCRPTLGLFDLRIPPFSSRIFVPSF